MADTIINARASVSNGAFTVRADGPHVIVDPYITAEETAEGVELTVTNTGGGVQKATIYNGAAGGFGQPTASADGNTGTPGVTVTASGPDTAKVFDFAFTNLKGSKGDKGDKGDTGVGVPTGGTTGQYLAKTSGTNYATGWKSPSSSTPKMDGTAAAGTSMDLSRADHVHPHDSLIVRKNLLDNWYFVGGGTGTYGVFPVNQRGQASYSTNQAYCVDRWIWRTSSALTVGASGLSFTATAGYRLLFQPINNGVNNLAGKKVTISALISGYSGTDSGVLSLYNANTPYGGASQVGGVSISGNGLFSKTIDIPSSLSYPYLNFGIGAASTSTSCSFTIEAVKLELGDTQTLAHLEGTTWVLNEIPNFSDELAKCQRYFTRLNTASTRGRPIGFGYVHTTSSLRLAIPLPQPMVADPAVSASSGLSLKLLHGGSSTELTPPTFASTGNAVPRMHGSVCTVEIDGSDLVSNEIYIAAFYGTSAYIDFSADL